MNYHHDRLNLNLTGLYTGWRDDARYTYTAPFFFNSARVENNDNFVLNFAGTYDLVRDWGYANTIQLWVRLNNILDERYQEVYGYSSPRFSMLGGVRVIFGLKPQSKDKEQKAGPTPPLRSKFTPGFSENTQENNRL
jgi:outer membrane cobalamin receptor